MRNVPNSNSIRIPAVERRACFVSQHRLLANPDAMVVTLANTKKRLGSKNFGKTKSQHRYIIFVIIFDCVTIISDIFFTYF